MRAGNGEDDFGCSESWHGNVDSQSMAELTGQHPVRSAVVAVLHFFGNQMTSTRGEEAMREGSTVQRSAGYHDAPISHMGNGWVEAGRAA